MKIESASDFTSSPNESPGAIHSLPSEVLKNIFSYIGTGYFKLIGPVSKDFCYSYLTMDSVEDTYAHPMNRQLAIDRNKATTADATSSSIELAEYCFLNAQDTFQAKILVKAAIKGRRDIVVMGHALGVNVDKAFQGNSYALVEITKRGDLEMVQFLEEQGLNISLFVKDIINAASSHGHVHILQWLHGTHALPKHVFRICFEAACEGRLDVIKWAENILGRDEEFEKDFMDAAAKLGHLNVVKWYRSRGIQWDELHLLWQLEVATWI